MDGRRQVASGGVNQLADRGVTVDCVGDFDAVEKAGNCVISSRGFRALWSGLPAWPSLPSGVYQRVDAREGGNDGVRAYHRVVECVEKRVCREKDVSKKECVEEKVRQEDSVLVKEDVRLAWRDGQLPRHTYVYIFIQLSDLYHRTLLLLPTDLQGQRPSPTFRE